MVGRAPGKNIIMLEANSYATCILHETVIHELMHTIGLWHEQMRYDRDQYIRIHYENIPQSLYAQFKKVPKSQSSTHGRDYDYYSVMHYAKDAFAMIPGEITMETKDPKAQNIIGNVKDASPSDYKKICSIYKCSKCVRHTFTGATSVSTNRKSGKRRGHDKKGKNEKKHHGRRGRKHRGEHKTADSFSDFIDNIFKFKPANEEKEENFGNDLSKVSKNTESADGISSNIASFDFFDILQNDDEVDIEPDSWAKSWLDSVSNQFPDLSDTWEIDFIRDKENNESPFSLSIPSPTFPVRTIESRRSIEMFVLDQSSEERMNEPVNSLFSIFGR